MRLITRYELTNRSNSELSAIFRQVSDALARTAIDSPERRNALASLENIRHEQAARLMRPRF
jgi:hypothetical protein